MAAIMRQPELWDKNTLRTEHEASPHTQVSDIWLRFNDLEKFKAENEYAGVIDEHESIDYPAFVLLPQARQLIFDLMRVVEGKRLGRVLITKMVPGTKIDPHVDGGEHAKYYERYHIILQNNPGSIFRCGKETICSAAGEVWWFNNQIEHEVINNSNDDRISMIVDIKC